MTNAMTSRRTNGALAFAETPGQAAAALAALPGGTVVGVSANVEWWAEVEQAPVMSIETLVPEPPLFALGERAFPLVDGMIREADSLLSGVTAGMPYADCVSFAAFFHYLKATFDGLLLRTEHIGQIFDLLSPREVLAFRLPPYQVTGITSLDRRAWGLTSRLSADMAAAHGIDIRWLDHPGDDTSVPVIDEQASPPAPMTQAGRLTDRIARRLSRLFRQLCGFRTDQPVLITSLFADLGEGITTVWQNEIGGRIMSLSEAFPPDPSPVAAQESRQAGEKLWPMLVGHKDFRQFFLWRGVDLFPYMEQQLKQIVIERIPALLLLARQTGRSLLEEGRHRNAALLAGGWVDNHYVLARLAGRAGLPVISHHYGGFLGYSHLPKHERYDFAECDYFLCGGWGAASNLASPTPHGSWPSHVKRARPVATGMPWVEKLVEAHCGATAPAQRSGARRRVMVVMNAFLGDCRDFGFTFMPEQAYWRWLRQVVEHLATRTELDVILKPPLSARYPQLENPILDWLARRDLPHFSVIKEVPLKDCLEEADAFILESPSTPLLHVVATRKPLLLYIDRDSYLLSDLARETLSRRCGVFAENDRQFMDCLPTFLARNDWSAGCDNQEFLRAFATHANDGGAGQRAARFIREVSRQPQLPDEVLAQLNACPQ